MNINSNASAARALICLALVSCHPCDSPHDKAKTVVWDIHGAPPVSGHAMLVQPASPSNGVWPNQWTLLSDTLKWDPETGELEWPHVPLDAWWHIESNDPCHPGTTRVDRFPTSTDTCQMTSQTTLHLSGKIHRTLGATVTGYRLDFKAAGDKYWLPVKTWPTVQGVIRSALRIPITRGPWLFRLVRLHDGKDSKVIHETTRTSCEDGGWNWTWNDLDAQSIQP